MTNANHERVYKSVKQSYQPTSDIMELLENFRQMVNDSIRIGLDEKVTSMHGLCSKAYHRLDQYSVPTRYRLTAISRAAGILKNYRKSSRKNPTRVPYARKLMLTDCYGFRVEECEDAVSEKGQGSLRIRLPIGRRTYVYIPLNDHTRGAIAGCVVRSITLTEGSLSIGFCRDVEETKPSGLLGIDRNLDNVTVGTNLEVKRFNLSKATEIKTKYREVKSHFGRNDVRIGRSIFQKYGTLQRNKVNQILHHRSKEIVEMAKSENLGIVMEDLKGIRKLYRRGQRTRKELSRSNELLELLRAPEAD